MVITVFRANHLLVKARRSDAAALRGGGGALSVRRHWSAILVGLGPSSDNTPICGGGLRARCVAYLGRVGV